MSGHTPGPWRRRDSAFPIVEDGRGDLVASAHWAHRRVDEMEANCRLIAAAPDLLAFARQVLQAHPWPPRDNEPDWEADYELARETGYPDDLDMYPALRA